MKSSFSEGLFFFKLNCKLNKLLQQILDLGPSGMFSNIATALHIFSVHLHQWFWVNVLLMCHNKNYYRSTMRRAIGFVTLNTKVTFSTIIKAFLVKKAKKAFGK
jgi:hypothetical protein